MKNLYLFVFLVFYFSVYSGSVQAQFVNRLKNAAERGISRAIEKKVESEMEKVARRQLDKVFKDVYGVDPADSAANERINQIMQSVYSDVEVADSYDFNGFSIVEFSGVDEKGKAIDPFQLTSFLASDPKITAMQFKEQGSKKSEDGTLTLIYDFNLNVAVTLMVNDGQQMRMAYAYDAEMLSAPIESPNTTEEPTEESVKFEKTGNTKTILGYECDEYLIETDENTTLYWVTQSPVNSTPSFWGQNNPFLTARMKSSNPNIFGQMPTGNMMEAHVTSKKDKGKFDMVVVEINPEKPQTFVMEDYPQHRYDEVNDTNPTSGTKPRDIFLGFIFCPMPAPVLPRLGIFAEKLKQTLKISIIVAKASNNVIGKNNELVWKLSSDLRRFKSLTTGHCIIMGRKTYESIGKPLPNRTSIVISRNPNFELPEGHFVASSLEDAIQKAIGTGQNQVFVIGGAEIYLQSMDIADELIVTEIHAQPDGDAFFPEIDPASWEKISEENFQKDESNQYDFDFVVYKRRKQ